MKGLSIKEFWEDMGSFIIFVSLIIFILFLFINIERIQSFQDLETIKKEYINSIVNRKTITCGNKVYKNFSFANNSTIILLENGTTAYHTLECSKID